MSSKTAANQRSPEDTRPRPPHWGDQLLEGSNAVATFSDRLVILNVFPAAPRLLCVLQMLTQLDVLNFLPNSQLPLVSQVPIFLEKCGIVCKPGLGGLKSLNISQSVQQTATQTAVFAVHKKRNKWAENIWLFSPMQLHELNKTF